MRMKIASYIGIILVILSITSIITGVITQQYELFGCISLVCTYTGLLAGIIAWILLIREWNQQEKEWNKENNS